LVNIYIISYIKGEKRKGRSRGEGKDKGWSIDELNVWPLQCKSNALPAELIPQERKNRDSNSR
jgi:hypothetical protein